MTFRIPNYVRSRRKRWHLSQRELAFLLGLSSQAVISQHESLARLPQTRVILKYEAVFGEPIGGLFPKLRKEVEREVIGQAKLLLQHLENRHTATALRKKELLEALIRRLESGSP